MIKVLFICLGNICRSPMAEAILNHKVKEKGLEGKIKCDSCGTSDFHIGEFPDERSLQCTKSRGILINHRGRQINKLDLKDFNYLIVMDQYNLKTVQQLLKVYGISNVHLYLMRKFQPGADHLDVPDPYYGDKEGFETVYEILDESLDNFLNHLIKNQLSNV